MRQLIKAGAASKPRVTYFHEAADPELTDRLLRFRKRVLIDEHGWDLCERDGRERDEFDLPHTVHCAIERSDVLIGSFRALRADTPYLAATKFADLATERPYTRSPLAWEVSRLTILPGEERFATSLLVYAAMFTFIERVGAKAVTGFCDVAHERLLKRIGIETRLYGPPATIGHDAFGRPITVVAGEMPLPAQGGVRFARLMSLMDETEIRDETALLGRSRLSA